MPRAGVSARPARRSAAPWWEDLDREAFRFPAAREVRLRDARMREVQPAEWQPAEWRAGGATRGTRADEIRPGATAPTKLHPVDLRPRSVRAREVRAAERPRRPVPTPEAQAPAPPLPAPASVTPSDRGRRTVAIRGYGAERNLPLARPTLRRYERPVFRPDLMALWALLLGLCLVVVAAATPHGAVLH